MNIIPFFPQLLFHCTIPVPENLIEYCSILAKGEKDNRSVYNGWETPNNLHENEDFSNKFLKNYFLPKINEELSTINFPNWDLRACWVTKLEKNGYHVTHIHSGCHYAFAWYLNVTENTGGELSIRNPNEYNTELILKKLDPRINDEYNLYPALNITPKTGLLVMFPAYLYHGVLPSLAENRITMSGNIVISL